MVEFTDTINTPAEALTFTPTVDKGTDFNLPEAINTASHLLKASVQSRNTTFKRELASEYYNVYQDALGFKESMSEGMIAERQNKITELERITAADKAIQALNRKYNGRYSAELVDIQKALVGGSTRELAFQTEKELKLARLKKQQELEITTKHKMTTGELPYLVNEEGKPDFQKLEFAQANVSLLLENYKEGKITAGTKEAAVNLGSINLNGDIKLAQNPEQVTNPAAKPYYRALNKIINGISPTQNEIDSAKTYIKLKENQVINSLVGALRQKNVSVAPQHIDMIKNSVKEYYITPALSVLESTKSNAEVIKNVIADKAWQNTENNHSLLAIAQLKQLFPNETILNVLAQENNIDVLKDFLNSANKLASKDYSNLTPKEAKSFVDVSAKTTLSDDREKEVFTKSMVKLLEDTSSNNDDITEVSKSLTNPERFSNLFNNTQTQDKEEVLNKLDKSMNFIKRQIKPIEGLSLKRDGAIIYVDTSNVSSFTQSAVELAQGKPLSALGTLTERVIDGRFDSDARKQVDLLNNYMALASVYQQIAHQPYMEAQAIIKGIPEEPLPRLSSGEFVVGDKAYYLPKSQIQYNLANPKIKSLYETSENTNISKDTVVAKEVTIDLPEFGTQENLMTVDELIDKSIELEGGFVNDPDDSGGATNFGITQKTLSNYLDEKVTVDDVKNLSKDKAKEIYKNEFYIKPKIDKLPEHIQSQVFDWGIHSSPKTAIKELQKLAGVEADGIIGEKTIEAAKNVSPEEFLRARINYYTKLAEKRPKDKKFLKGWIDRAKKVASLPHTTVP